jgi:signal transduction histidine kinase
LTEIRHAIAGLAPEKLKSDNLIEALEYLILDYQSTGLAIDFSVESEVDSIEPGLSDTIYRACQEALTNSLKHGQAKQVMILLRFLNGGLRVYISDDGCGCKTLNKGLGLSGMEQRIKSLNGDLFYGSDGEHGFNIRIEIPFSIQMTL